ncbi:hypothetical protein GOV14_07050 [Candidatus Pacearchaeota archaeon]|nr:hypothetical protein [Candidatus Pacearchaeota archaeon]
MISAYAYLITEGKWTGTIGESIYSLSYVPCPDNLVQRIFERSDIDPELNILDPRREGEIYRIPGLLVGDVLLVDSVISPEEHFGDGYITGYGAKIINIECVVGTGDQIKVPRPFHQIEQSNYDARDASTDGFIVEDNIDVTCRTFLKNMDYTVTPINESSICEVIETIRPKNKYAKSNVIIARSNDKTLLRDGTEVFFAYLTFFHLDGQFYIRSFNSDPEKLTIGRLREKYQGLNDVNRVLLLDNSDGEYNVFTLKNDRITALKKINNMSRINLIIISKDIAQKNNNPLIVITNEDHNAYLITRTLIKSKGYTPVNLEKSILKS